MHKQILHLTAIFIATSGLLACSAPAKKQSSLRVIDAHIHTHFTGKPNRWSGIIDSRESLLKEMKKNNVVGAVAHTEHLQQDYVDLVPNGIVHCAGVKARVQTSELEKGLREGRYKCIKIYLGYERQFAYDKNYAPVYRLAEKYKVPVVFHTGDTSESDALLKYTDPMTIDEVAVQYRKVNFVLAHLGNPWIQTAAEVAYKNPNVYIDVSALMVGDLAKTTAEDIEEYVVKPIRWAFGYCEDPGKLMFGTDWPLTGMANYIEAVKRAIPEEHWDDVFYKNAARVFSIPVN